MIPLNTIQCRDCLEGMLEIEDKSIDLVITDPPYGIKADNVVEGRIKRDHNGWKDYGVSDWDLNVPKKEYFEEMFRISKNQIIFGGNYFSGFLPSSQGWIVWDKGQRDFSLADGELAWTSFDKALRIFSYSRALSNFEDDKIHPTQKPVKLFEWIIKNYAKEGDTICDPFFGSGSCLVAAVRMGHQFIGFEKEVSYFEKAQVRIKKAQEQGKIGSWFE
jgi:site-specific DNA-methyltransferase (adenine-specific)